jgi:hypothetical protein
MVGTVSCAETRVSARHIPPFATVADDVPESNTDGSETSTGKCAIRKSTLKAVK